MHAIIDEPTTAVDAMLDEQPEADARATLTSVLAKLHERIPPLWRLQDYVAVNPFMGWADHDLLSTHQAMSQLRSCELLMSRSWFRQQWSTGRFGAQDVEIACNEFAQLHPQQRKVPARKAVVVLNPTPNLVSILSIINYSYYFV